MERKSFCAVLSCYSLFETRWSTTGYFLKHPPEDKSNNDNARFIVEAIRQQSELAFNHIMETIDNEHKTLNAYFELNETRIAPDLLQATPMQGLEPQSLTATMEASAANAIYCEIESLADQGMSVADISDKLNVPRGEVDLVIKLKHLSLASTKNKTNPQNWTFIPGIFF